MGFLDRMRRRDPRVDEIVAPAGTKIMVGAPANPPPAELVERLRGRCAHHPEIAAAYLFQMMIVAEGENPTLALGLVLGNPLGEERLRELVDDLGANARPLRPEDDYLAIQVLNEDSLPSVVAHVEPIFERST
jgi:SseB protein C-terminal domain